MYGFRPNRNDTQNLRTAVRAVASVDPHVSRSNLLRDGLALLAHQAQQGGDWVDLVRERQERADLERRLELAERKAKQAERNAQRSATKARKTELDMEALLRHLPDIRRRVQLNLDFPMGVHVVDQLWQNCGRSWARVVARLERVQEELEQDPPPGGTP